MSSKLILDNDQISKKIKRMAYEIYENNFDAKELTLLGIEDHGYKLAESLLADLQAIFPVKFNLHPITIDKKKPGAYSPELSELSSDIKNKHVIFVDDVLNSGKTMIYAIKPFLDLNPKTLQIAVLINRENLNYPIQPDYTGLSLGTTIQEHVEVKIDKSGSYQAFLS